MIRTLDSGVLIMIVLDIVLLTIGIFGLVLLVLRRNFFPIKGRGPFPVIFFCNFLIFINAVAITSLFLAPDMVSCVMDIIFLNGCIIALFTLFALRVVLLIAKHVSMLQTGQIDVTQLRFIHEKFWRSMRLLSLISRWWSLLIAFIVFTMVQMIPFIVIAAKTPTYLTKSGCMVFFTQANTILLGFKIGWITLHAFAVFLIVANKINDAFRLAQELTITITCFAISNIARTLLQRFDAEIEIPLSVATLISLEMVAFVMGCIVPVFRTYAEEKAQKRMLRRSQRIINLPSLLSSPQGEDMFRRHLIREFSVENLSFYRNVEAFKTAPEEKIPEIAFQIYEIFIRDGSEAQVNLPSRIRDEITKSMFDGTPTVNTFDKASKTIFDLMECDSFRRFLKYSKLTTLKNLGADA